MAHKETILVTGASGFIGGWLVETLHLSNSADVRAGIRSWSSAARLGRFPIEIVPCDVMDTGQVAQAVGGTTCVIHCAAGASEVIIQGTNNMLDASLRAGVRRFIHLSTTEIYGSSGGEIDETSPYQYTGNPYSDSKIEAEELCWDYYGKGLPITVIRPSIVYGPFSKDWTIGLAHRLQSGNWGVFEGYGEGICNLVYIADLVAGILLAARHECAVGEAFNLSGPEPITWNQYFQRFNAALGLPELKPINLGSARFRTTAMAFARLLAKSILSHFDDPIRKAYQRFRQAREGMQYVEKSIRTVPTPAELSLYSRAALYLTTKAQNLLGFEPKFGIDSGLEMTVSWLNHLGLVDHRA